MARRKSFTQEEILTEFEAMLDDPDATVSERIRTLLAARDMLKAAGAGDRVGPPEPQTREDYRQRLMLFIECAETVHPGVTRAAYRAFRKGERVAAEYLGA